MIATLSRSARGLFGDADYATMRAYYSKHPELRATPLRPLPALAAHLGLGHLWAKDESTRFGLNAFKSLGTRFAVDTLIARGDVHAGDMLVCASEGNHGRAVARAAQAAGCPCRVYMADSVAASRAKAVADEGAAVVLVAGGYDDAVRQATSDGAAHGWTMVSDTSWAGYSEVPRLVMLGYTRMMDEVADERGATWRPAAVFVQGGVGGLLAAVASWVATHWHDAATTVVAVEPASAASLQASARAGRPVDIAGPFPTQMAGLRCGVVSPLAFEAIRDTVGAYMSIEDTWAERAMRHLALPRLDDARIACGAAGAAAFGGVLAALDDPAQRDVRDAIPLDSSAEVLVIVSEGVTDTALWKAVVAGA